MKKNVVTTTYYEREDVKEVTLLTVEQAKKLSDKTLSCDEWWWLRSPGDEEYLVAYVYCDGDVDEGGTNNDCDYGTIRPAFVIPNLEKANGKIYVGKIPCTKIDKDLALADNYVCYSEFDPVSNNWEESNLKRYIESDEFWDRFIEEGE